MRFGQFNHPEQRPGEVFVAYFVKQAASITGYRSKRLGEPVDDGLGDKDAHGRPVGDDVVFPLFISEEEAREAGIIPAIKSDR